MWIENLWGIKKNMKKGQIPPGEATRNDAANDFH